MTEDDRRMAVVVNRAYAALFYMLVLFWSVVGAGAAWVLLS